MSDLYGTGFAAWSEEQARAHVAEEIEISIRPLDQSAYAEAQVSGDWMPEPRPGAK
ncbi:MAG TPA: hypothetical protein VFA03_04515 [Acetobacteraceae bacterium]|nr:hypothetical protein [Acetobacteraceae bacterium]